MGGLNLKKWQNRYTLDKSMKFSINDPQMISYHFSPSSKKINKVNPLKKWLPWQQVRFLEKDNKTPSFSSCEVNINGIWLKFWSHKHFCVLQSLFIQNVQNLISGCHGNELHFKNTQKIYL